MLTLHSQVDKILHLLVLGAGTVVETTVGVPESARLPRIVAPPREVSIAQHRAVGEALAVPDPLRARGALQAHHGPEIDCAGAGVAGSGLRRCS